MTMLGAHFKISSNEKNPFEKQKEWRKAKKDKEEFRDPIIYLTLAIATDKDKTFSPESFMSGNAVAVFYYQSRNSNPSRATPS